MSELRKKLAIIQSTLNAPRDRFNNFGNYSYRSCEGILEALKPLLVANELVQTINDEVVYIGNRYYVKSTVTVSLQDGEDSISCSALARESEVKKGMDESQITGACSSYARKYALNGMYCIDDAKDADTVGYREQAESAAKAETKKKIHKNTTEQQNDEIAKCLILLNKTFDDITSYCSKITNRSILTPYDLTEIEANKLIHSLRAKIKTIEAERVI